MKLFCICYELVKTLVLYDVINDKNLDLIHSRSCNECFHEAYIRVSSGVQFPRDFFYIGQNSVRIYLWVFPWPSN